MEMKIDLRRCVYELLKRTPIIIVSTLIFAVLGVIVGLSTSSESTYSAKASVCSLVYGSFASISKSSRVASRAAIILGDSSLTSDDIKDMTIVQASAESSSIMEVYAYSTNPDQAVNVANAVAQAFVIEVKSITGSEDIQVLDSAQSAKIFVDESAQQMKIILIFTVLGFLLICFIIVMITIFSSKVMSLEECQLDGSLELIGVIPDSKQI